MDGYIPFDLDRIVDDDFKFAGVAFSRNCESTNEAIAMKVYALCGSLRAFARTSS